MKYLVPEYYKHFECKCGNCRSSCCDGWPVRISMKEYYRLLSIQCSSKLRSRLDCALKLNTEQSNEGHALISTDWQGICMLHREDGFCALQSELGETCLPEVCRLYPRKTRHLKEHNTCSCSNSCEAMVELLIKLKEPFLFEEVELSTTPIFETKQPFCQNNYLNTSISILQNHNLPLAERLLTLGHQLSVIDSPFERPVQLFHAFRILYLLEQYFSDSLSVEEYCKVALRYYCIEDKEALTVEDLNIVTEKYNLALKKLASKMLVLEKLASNMIALEKLVSERIASEMLVSENIVSKNYNSQCYAPSLLDWQTIFEQLLINHIIYNNFPYNDNQENIGDAFLSLGITYSFLRFNLLGNLSTLTTQEKLVDFLSAMFRLIEHSNFQRASVSQLKKEQFPLQVVITELLYL